MKHKTQKRWKLLLGVTLMASAFVLPAHAEGSENMKDAANITITTTEITADGVINADGYGSIYKKVVWKEGAENIEYESSPQAALIDRNGNYLFSYKDTWLKYYCDDGIVSLVAERPSQHYYLANGQDDPVGFYNLDGTEAFSLNCFGASRMVDGLSFVQAIENENDLSNARIDAYLIDRTGNRIHTFDENSGFKDIVGFGGNDFQSVFVGDTTAAYFGNDLLLSWYAEGGCDVFYLNKNGEKVLDISKDYDTARIFSEGLAPVRQRASGKWGFINTEGTLVIPCIYEEASDFKDGLVPVKKDDKWGYINTSGEIIIPFEYENAFGAGDGLASVGKDGKYGLVNCNNEVVVPFEYDDISSYDGEVAYAIKDHKVSIITGYEPKKDDANPFSDVAEKEYYYNPVLWAVENKITAGTSATTFSPNASCTRAQIVTFLWNAAGQPDPKENNNPFTDVTSGAYYYKAVLWAVENKITAGTTTTTFSPDADCTRGQVVTFLHNYAGKVETDNASNPFTDVKEGAYYYTPVLWAVANKVTAGTSPTTFSPDLTCTRGQIVTFLYNDLGR